LILDKRSTESLVVYFIYEYFHRDAPEATGDEPEDADFETPKIYETVSL
jgi:dynein heavy chain